MLKDRLLFAASNTYGDLSTGEMYSFGSNVNGQTGLGTTVGNTLSPFQVEFSPNWDVISAGYLHSVAIRSDGSMWSFGANTDGQTGLGLSVGDTLTPTQVGVATDWVDCSAGRSHSLAVNNSGELYAFGANTSGQTGFGTTAGSTLVPTKIGVATDWLSVSAGAFYSLVTKTDGTMYSFGTNNFGCTGQGISTGDTLVPTQIGIAIDWLYISAGYIHSLAIKTDGTMFAFGGNFNGRTGLGLSTGNTLVPTQVGVATDWMDCSAGRFHSVTIRSDGSMWSFGDNADGITGLGLSTGNTLVPTQVGVATDWLSVSVGETHSLAIKTNNTIYSFGSNANGQTGFGTTVGNTLTPAQIGIITKWIKINAGVSYSLSLQTP
jgi:alpha-tubulin suppressor-like RCC1 family protein